MKTSVTGAGTFLARNQVYDLPEEKAKMYIDAKFATVEAVNTMGKREKAIRNNIQTR